MSDAILRKELYYDFLNKALTKNIELKRMTIDEMYELSPKIHTIRTDYKNRWKAGCKIHAVYNNRTKNMFKFAPTFECNGTQTIEIKYFYSDDADAQTEVWIDGRLLIQSEIELLAKNDGFDNVYTFFLYFHTDFKGKIIHFTNFRY